METQRLLYLGLIAVGLLALYAANSQTTNQNQSKALEPPPPKSKTADGDDDVREAQWARQIASQKFRKADAADLLPPLPNKRLQDNFQERALAAAHDDEKVTPISLSYNQFIDNETQQSRLFPLYTSKSIDPFIQPYYMIQANLGAMDKAYLRAQTF